MENTLKRKRMNDVYHLSLVYFIFFTVPTFYHATTYIFRKEKKKKSRSFIKLLYTTKLFALFIFTHTYFFVNFFIFLRALALPRISSLTCFTPHSENNIKTFDVSILFVAAYPLDTHYAFIIHIWSLDRCLPSCFIQKCSK